jgi:hypothetical protein
MFMLGIVSFIGLTALLYMVYRIGYNQGKEAQTKEKQ